MDEVGLATLTPEHFMLKAVRLVRSCLATRISTSCVPAVINGNVLRVERLPGLQALLRALAWVAEAGSASGRAL